MTEVERLRKRVAELEAEVESLKKSPQHVIHSHYHYGQPMWAQPSHPWPQYPQITYGVRGTAEGGILG